jgi:hypothetical protein
LRAAEWLLMFSILFFFILFAPDAATYANTMIKANQVADYAVERMALEGGWTNAVRQDVEAQMRKHNLDPNVWTVRHTEGRISHPGEVYFGLQHVYRISAFDIFGEKMTEALKNRLVLPISISKQKVSQVIIR